MDKILLFCVILVVVLFLLCFHSGTVIVEAISNETAPDKNTTNPLPDWKKQEYQSGTACPATVSHCLVSDMIDKLNTKINTTQNLIEQYTKEIEDIENRYPITFKINRVDISSVYLDGGTLSTNKLTYGSWVTGNLPYPQLSFTFPKAPPGLPGDKGPPGNPGLALNQSMLPQGERGPPGYVGVAK